MEAFISSLDNTLDFSEENVRQVGSYEEPWFVAKDVCKVLELGNVTEAMKIIDNDWKKMELFKSGNTEKPMIIINEQAVYKLIIRNKKPLTEKIQNIICENILVNTRKSGNFSIIEESKEAPLEKEEIKFNNSLIFKSDLTDGKDLRVLGKPDEPWFIAKDIAGMLGYTDTDKSIRNHVDNDDKITFKYLKNNGSETRLLDISSEDQECPDENSNNDPSVLAGLHPETILINESGLYSLILRSKLPKALKFKQWVTSEVLPSIRKTGEYKYIEYQEQIKRLEETNKCVVFEKNDQQRETRLREYNYRKQFSKTLLDIFKGKYVVYIGYIGKINGVDTYKFGFTDHIIDRNNVHNSDYGTFELVFCIECEKNNILETKLKDHEKVKKRQFTHMFKDENKTELLTFDDEFTFEDCKKLLEKLKNDMEELNKLKLEIEKTKQEEAITKRVQEEHLTKRLQIEFDFAKLQLDSPEEKSDDYTEYLNIDVVGTEINTILNDLTRDELKIICRDLMIKLPKSFDKKYLIDVLKIEYDKNNNIMNTIMYMFNKRGIPSKTELTDLVRKENKTLKELEYVYKHLNIFNYFELQQLGTKIGVSNVNETKDEKSLKKDELIEKVFEQCKHPKEVDDQLIILNKLTKVQIQNILKQLNIKFGEKDKNIYNINRILEFRKKNEKTYKKIMLENNNTNLLKNEVENLIYKHGKTIENYEYLSNNIDSVFNFGEVQKIAKKLGATNVSRNKERNKIKKSELITIVLEKCRY